jgi:hypothetical protein
VLVQVVNKLLAHRESLLADVAGVSFVIVVGLEMSNEITELAVRLLAINALDERLL